MDTTTKTHETGELEPWPAGGGRRQGGWQRDGLRVLWTADEVGLVWRTPGGHWHALVGSFDESDVLQAEIIHGHPGTEAGARKAVEEHIAEMIADAAEVG